MEVVKKKILQICAIDLSVEHLLKPLIKEQLAEGHEVHIACAKEELFEDLQNDGFEMKEIAFVRKISLLGNLKSIHALYKLMTKEQYDIVHVHTPIAALLGRIAAKLAKVETIIYTAHGFYFNEDMSKASYLFYYSIEKIAARLLTDFLLIQSKEDYDLAIKKKFMKEEKILHLSNGVDVFNKFNPEFFSLEDRLNYREKLNIKEDAIVYLFVGRLVSEKGILELLEAFNKMKKNYGKAVLVVVGDTSGSEREQLFNYKEMKDIHFLGSRKDVNALLYMSDLFVLPSHREGLPRSIIEAMAMQKPIIATDIRGCREEVFEDVNGKLVTPKNTQHLFEAMVTLYESSDMRNHYGENSRNIAIAHFNEAKVLAKQLSLMNELPIKG